MKKLQLFCNVAVLAIIYTFGNCEAKPMNTVLLYEEVVTGTVAKKMLQDLDEIKTLEGNQTATSRNSKDNNDMTMHKAGTLVYVEDSQTTINRRSVSAIIPQQLLKASEQGFNIPPKEKEPETVSASTEEPKSLKKENANAENESDIKLASPVRLKM